MKTTTPGFNVAVIFGLVTLIFAGACSDAGQGSTYDEKIQTSDARPETERETGSEQVPSMNNLHLELKSAGIDFYATGNEPFWTLTMDFDSLIIFKTPEGEEIRVPPVQAVRAQDADVRRYRAVTEAVELIIQLRHRPCTDNLSGEHFDYAVSVEQKRNGDTEYVKYNGCGVFRRDPRIHNIWIVEEIDGQKLAPADYVKGIPTLEFNIGEGRILGHDGCNSINGRFEMEMNTITFGPLSGTLMSCPNAELSARIGKILSQQTYRYEFSDRLELKRGEEVRMRLRNVD